MSRPLCQTCKRPLPVCYCSALVNIANKVKVLIIQHPLEEKHPFNTGRMANLCLNNSELIIAEQFSDTELDTILAIPSALLYPSLPWLPETDKADRAENTVASNTTENRPKHRIQQLIVIDATWRKSKKILHLNPRLQILTRMSLSGDLKSNYQIRKTSIADGLSTLESIVKAMAILEPEINFHPMLKPFEKMIAMQPTTKN
jgi:DTW domain-containing protein